MKTDIKTQMAAAPAEKVLTELEVRRNDTPRTDENAKWSPDGLLSIAFARQLERELNAVTADRDAWREVAEVARAILLETKNLYIDTNDFRWFVRRDTLLDTLKAKLK